ncbi:hypothetical protein [Rhizobium tubonense]|uniref:Uncharacterized protein n=1 Tax=Rhizobium tubonense TaxID=484088 RepID=A0A2W4C5C7_9HYPH|nr:hypothetical protein [Rhizobium tubonense]PZM08251.1 hypothetical protein CPY51_29430 [Rhizobium tubonense]
MEDAANFWGSRLAQDAEYILGGDARLNVPRAGGLYEITSRARVTVSELSNQQKAYLTTWLVDQRRLGVAVPLITHDVVELATTARPKTLAERRDGLLEAILEHAPRLGEAMHHDEAFRYSLEQPDAPNPFWTKEAYLMAATESVAFNEVETLIGFARGKGLIEADGYQLIPTLIEIDSRDSQKRANLNRWRKQEVCDGFGGFFASGF